MVMFYFVDKFRKSMPNPHSITAFCDGDDTLLFVPHEYEAMAAKIIQNVAASLCLTVKLENRCDGPDGVVFCQHKLDAQNIKFLPDPVRVWNMTASGIINKDTPA